MSELMSLDLILIAACIWLAIGLVGVSQPHNFRLISRVLFPLGAFISLVVAGIALASIAAEPQFRILPLGLPDLPFHLRLDALSSFFLFLLGATSAGISIYAAGYFRPSEGGQPGLHCLLYHGFLTSIVFIFLADDGYAFMVAWESMALSRRSSSSPRNIGTPRSGAPAIST
jgi:hydrogenase-4 component B